MKYNGCEYDDLVRHVNAVLDQYDMRLTVRQIYYRLVSEPLMLFENTRSSYNGLSRFLVHARERDHVDADRIEDRSRNIEDRAFDSPEDFMGACLYTLRNRHMTRWWKTQDHWVEVWVEKDALSQLMANAVYPFNTVVAPSRGYSSYSYLRDAVARLTKYSRDKGTRAVILHFADHDPSGIDMTRDLRQRLARYGADVFIRRIALTYDQVQERNLAPNPAKRADTRSRTYMAQFGDECWELDAIPPDELVQMVSDAVGAEITDPDAWEEVQQSHAALKEWLDDRLEDIIAEMETEPWLDNGENDE